MIRTKREEIAEREARIVDLALSILDREGIAAIDMGAIATELGMTRGTVYNHFRNKEAILLALAIHAVEQRLALFEAAAMLRGSPRQRMAAIGVASDVYVDRFPGLQRMEHQIRHDAVWERTSPEQRNVLIHCEGRCMHTVTGIVRDAVASGDLVLPDGQRAEDIVFGLWSMTFGGTLLEVTSPSLSAVGIGDPRQAIRRACNTLLDGLGWQPLYEPAAYEAWIAEVRAALERIPPLSAGQALARGSKCRS